MRHTDTHVPKQLVPPSAVQPFPTDRVGTLWNVPNILQNHTASHPKHPKIQGHRPTLNSLLEPVGSYLPTVLALLLTDRSHEGYCYSERYYRHVNRL
jgi:hypothetical protein